MNTHYCQEENLLVSYFRAKLFGFVSFAKLDSLGFSLTFIQQALIVNNILFNQSANITLQVKKSKKTYSKVSKIVILRYIYTWSLPAWYYRA